MNTAPARKPEPDERPDVDLQTELILRMMSDLRQLVVDENIETRKQFNDGLNRVVAEQKITNGRVNGLERDLAALDVRLEERTSNMVCAEHGATFKHLQEHLEDLRSLPDRVSRIEGSNSSNSNASVTSSTVSRKSALESGATRVKVLGVTGAGLAGLWVLLEAFWTFWTKRKGL
jgi:hypothetical protein